MTRSLRARLLAALLTLPLAACGAPETPRTPRPGWKVDRRVELAAAPRLAPDDQEQPGAARPQHVLVIDGRVWVSLAHLRRDPGYGAAGPGYLSIHDAQTLEELALIPLVLERGGEPEVCRNPGKLALFGNRVLVACSGTFADDGAVAELTPDGELVRILFPGGAPGSLLRLGSFLWTGDFTAGTLRRLSLVTGEVVNGRGAAPPVEICPAPTDRWELVGDLALEDGRAFASCFNSGHVVELDPTTGTIIGPRLEVGDGPIAFARSRERLFVVDGLGATLSFVQLGRPPTARRAALPLGQTPQGIAATDRLLAATNSGDGTVTFIDPVTLDKLASTNLKPAGGATSYPWGVALDGDVAFVALNGSSELVRLVREVP